MDRMKILITGASGFVGKNLLKKLIDIDYFYVYTITRVPFKLKNEKNINLDLTNKADLEKVLSDIKPDVIVHLAAGGVKYGEGDYETIFKVNSLSIIEIAELAKKIGINPKFIVAGSGFEYSLLNRPLKETDCLNPLSVYGISKATQSMLLKRYREDFTIFLLRFFSLYGTGEAKHRFIPYVISESIKGKKVKLTKCEQIRDYLHVDDAVDCIISFIKKEEKKGFFDFNVASGNEISLRDLVNLIKQELERKGYKTDIEFGALPYRKDEPMYYVADISKVKSYLGWKPKISLKEGINRTVEEIINEFKG